MTDGLRQTLRLLLKERRAIIHYSTQDNLPEAFLVVDYLRRSIDNVALDLKDIQRQQSVTKESLIRADERINNIDEKIHEMDNRIHVLEQK